jgi:hypothetical protein
MPFERYEILLPLNYNDGTPIEPEKFLWINPTKNRGRIHRSSSIS